MVMQIRRTPTVDHPPSGLAEGQLAVEMSGAWPKLWVGVPTSIDPSGRRLVVPSPGGAVAFGTTPPASPSPGDLWFDPVRAQLYIWFDDGDSQQWVVTVNQPSGGDNGGAGGPQMGVTDGSSAGPGEVGEYLTTVRSAATIQPYDSLTITLALTPGDWDVSATFAYYCPANGVIHPEITAPSYLIQPGDSAGSNTANTPHWGRWTMPPKRVNLSSADTVTLTLYGSQSAVATSLLGADITARRMR